MNEASPLPKRLISECIRWHVSRWPLADATTMQCYAHIKMCLHWCRCVLCMRTVSIYPLVPHFLKCLYAVQIMLMYKVHCFLWVTQNWRNGTKDENGSTLEFRCWSINEEIGWILNCKSKLDFGARMCHFSRLLKSVIHKNVGFCTSLYKKVLTKVSIFWSFHNSIGNSNYVLWICMPVEFIELVLVLSWE